jgi:hypothetical protein
MKCRPSGQIDAESWTSDDVDPTLRVKSYGEVERVGRAEGGDDTESEGDQCNVVGLIGETQAIQPGRL